MMSKDFIGSYLAINSFLGHVCKIKKYNFSIEVWNNLINHSSNCFVIIYCFKKDMLDHLSILKQNKNLLQTLKSYNNLKILEIVTKWFSPYKGKKICNGQTIVYWWSLSISINSVLYSYLAWERQRTIIKSRWMDWFLVLTHIFAVWRRTEKTVGKHWNYFEFYKPQFKIFKTLQLGLPNWNHFSRAPMYL